MEWVETTGKTVEEAKNAALDQLGVDETDAEFVVIGEPRTGLFGRMKGEARVRARVMPTSPRPKRPRGRRPEQRRSGAASGTGGGGGGSRQRSGGRGNRGNGGGGAISVAVAERQDAEGSRGSGGYGASANGSAGGAGGSSDQDGAGVAGAGTGAGRSRRRGSRGRGRGSANRPAGGASGDATDAGESGDENGRSGAGARSTAGGQGSGARSRGRAAEGTKEQAVGEVALEDQGQWAKEFIDGLMREMGLSAAVSWRVVDEDTAEVAVDGAELGMLIGPGGATLQALQELTRTVVQKRTGGHSDRILVDVAGYRARRAEALNRFASQIAEEVLASGTERALEPMGASDRKVVHDTINDISGVSTRSEGEEPRRYIVIAPVASAAADAD
ncbi:MAG: RNA-binding cell elongation regulator Jag/EloR [Acidimicrobiales bacterium]